MRKSLCLLFCAMLSLAQTAPPTPYTWVWDAVVGRWRIVPIQGATEVVSATGQREVQIAGGQTYQFGSGFLTVKVGSATQVALDTAYVLYRTPIAPTVPGPCGPSVTTGPGTGAIAADAQYIYLCVPSGTTFVWARAPMQTQW